MRFIKIFLFSALFSFSAFAQSDQEWALVDANGIVQNIIVYDGSSPYTPPQGLTLEQVNNWVQIGQNVNTPQPTQQ